MNIVRLTNTRKKVLACALMMLAAAGAALCLATTMPTPILITLLAIPGAIESILNIVRITVQKERVLLVQIVKEVNNG